MKEPRSSIDSLASKARNDACAWNGVVLMMAGVAIGGVSGAVFTAALGHPFVDLWLWRDGRLQWETLLGAAVAMVAALITVNAIRAQISDARATEAEKLRRKHRSVRAGLPNALSQIYDYATPCLRKFYELQAFFDEQGKFDEVAAQGWAKDWEIPSLPASALSMLKECIEFGDDEAAEALTVLIRHLQVQHASMLDKVARFRQGDPSFVTGRYNIASAILSLAELLARAAILFNYARGGDLGSPVPGYKSIWNALHVVGVWDNPLLDAVILKWEPREFAGDRLPPGLKDYLQTRYQAGAGKEIVIAAPEDLEGFVPEKGDSKQNVDRWVMLHPEHRAVRGYLYTGPFSKYSVVDCGGRLLDITPRTDFDPDRFRTFLDLDQEWTERFAELPNQI